MTDTFTSQTLDECLAEMDQAQDDLVARGTLKPSMAIFTKGIVRMALDFVRGRLKERGLRMVIVPADTTE